MLRVAVGVVHGIGDKSRVQTQLGRLLLAERQHRRRVVRRQFFSIEIELPCTACLEGAAAVSQEPAEDDARILKGSEPDEWRRTQIEKRPAMRGLLQEVYARKVK